MLKIIKLFPWNMPWNESIQILSYQLKLNNPANRIVLLLLSFVGHYGIYLFVQRNYLIDSTSFEKILVLLICLPIFLAALFFYLSIKTLLTDRYNTPDAKYFMLIVLDCFYYCLFMLTLAFVFYVYYLCFIANGEWLLGDKNINKETLNYIYLIGSNALMVVMMVFFFHKILFIAETQYASVNDILLNNENPLSGIRGAYLFAIISMFVIPFFIVADIPVYEDYDMSFFILGAPIDVLVAYFIAQWYYKNNH